MYLSSVLDICDLKCSLFYKNSVAQSHMILKSFHQYSPVCLSCLILQLIWLLMIPWSSFSSPQDRSRSNLKSSTRPRWEKVTQFPVLLPLEIYGFFTSITFSLFEWKMVRQAWLLNCCTKIFWMTQHLRLCLWHWLEIS